MHAEESLHVSTVVASPIGGTLQRKTGRAVSGAISCLPLACEHVSSFPSMRSGLPTIVLPPTVIQILLSGIEVLLSWHQHVSKRRQVGKFRRVAY